MRALLILTFLLCSCEYSMYFSNSNPVKPLIIVFKTLHHDYQAGFESAFEMRSLAYDKYYNEKSLNQLKFSLPSPHVMDYQYQVQKLGEKNLSFPQYKGYFIYKKIKYQVLISLKEKRDEILFEAFVTCNLGERNKLAQKPSKNHRYQAANCQITELNPNYLL